MLIEKENSFKQAINSGINVFVGAGFSTLASDETGRQLPTGSRLLEELNNEFGKKAQDLSMLATILRSSDNIKFNQYLTQRFKVGKFDDLYKNLNLISVKYFLTTNIDNLIPKIIDSNPIGYLHDIRDNGEATDKNAICYLPLHGNVDRPSDGYVFSTTEISSIFNNAPRIWQYLGHAVEKRPTLFLGYSMKDASTIQALFSQRFSHPAAQKDKWILTYNPEEDAVQYFKALGFNIVNGSIRELLEALPSLSTPRQPSVRTKGASQIKELFKANLIPETNLNLPARSIIHYFQGIEPMWGDILSGNIVRTSQYDEAIDKLRDPSRHTLIIGAPLCGKSTVAMQAAAEAKGFEMKFRFEDLTMTKAEYILKTIGNAKALIMIEDFAYDVDAFLRLSNRPNIKLLGVARSTDFGIISHLIDLEQFNVVNVTEVTDADLHKVYKSLPKNSKKGTMQYHHGNDKYRRDTIFEFVLQNIKGQSIEERYRSILKKSNPDHVEFMVLCAYMHYCRIPLSIEVAASYFNDRYSFYDMFKLKTELDDLIKEFEFEDADMDYYYPRSFHLADVMLKNSSQEVRRKVMWGIVNNVPQVQIPQYAIFKRKAFDHRIVAKAFGNWKEGCEFYKAAFAYDYDNPYVLQQQALYLSGKRQFRLAFDIIDRAKALTNDTQFSIRNTHAIILFEANIQSTDKDAVAQLDESMRILKKCYNDDKRKTYHAIVFAEQALRYHQKLPSDASKGYLATAKKWLEEERHANPWNRECAQTLSTITSGVQLIHN